MPEGGRERRISDVHTQVPHHITPCMPHLLPASSLLPSGRSRAPADAAKGTRAATSFLLLLLRVFSWPLHMEWIDPSEPGPLAGRRAAVSLTDQGPSSLSALAFGPIYLSIKCLRSRSIGLEVRVAVTGQPPRRHRPIQLVTRQCLDRILGGGSGGGEKKNELTDDRPNATAAAAASPFVRARSGALGGNQVSGVGSFCGG